VSNSNVKVASKLVVVEHVVLEVLCAPTLHVYKLMFKVKAPYDGQILLSQILFFETTCFLTSTKLILKGFFAMVLGMR
jgi:hypothetical protein